MLHLQNVTKAYKTKAGEVNAINGISLTFPDTGMVFITGKSGCGKTTLLNVIGGLDGIDGGEILVQDKKFSAFSPAEYDSYRNTFIGFIFQEYNLLPEFTVEKNIKIAMEIQGVQADETEVKKLLNEVGIDELRTRKPSELSGGQRQRVAIARALVKKPRIIMADEPTGALDSGTGVQVLDTLKKLSKDRLVIVVSHDREFAEKYADRLIHLVDGRVEQDVSFAEKEIQANVSEQENTLVVREGAKLSESETHLLVKAVQERKQISVLQNLRYREKVPTGEVERKAEEPIKFQKSKMKLKSAAFLGIKSLTVKPIRLVLTILISALAFAVFGLFDAVASVSTASILKNFLLENSSHAITTTAKFNVDYDKGNSYDVNVSDNVIATLNEETEGKVKGVTNGDYITEIRSANRIEYYYTNKCNGFLEFDGETEIESDGKFKNFDYKIVKGRYPKSVYTDNSEELLWEVALSTYFADSIIEYLNGTKLNGKEITAREELLGASITVSGFSYTIVGLIDCGEIPEKYEKLKENSFYNDDMLALYDQFETYINAGAHRCLFAGKGYGKATQNADVSFSIGNQELSFTTQGNSRTKQCVSYVYASCNYNANNILLFSGEYAQNGEIRLAGDEVLIHHWNLSHLFDAEILNLPMQTRREAERLITGMQSGTSEENRQALSELLMLLGNPVSDGYISADVTQESTVGGEEKTKTIKIVGVYFGVDVASSTTASKYKLMISDELMKELGIYTEQGHYSKILFSAESIDAGMDTIVRYLFSENDLSLALYSNSTLNVIQANEQTIKQFADLFLYVALVLALLAVFLLCNYISTSISSKKQSVGILRGLGAGGKDILLMFLSESLIISMLNAFLAVGFTVLGCALVNWYIMDIIKMSVQFALFSGRQVLLISLISLFTALVSSTLPIIHIVKKKPVALIRR